MSGNSFFFGWEISFLEWLQAHLGPVAVNVISLLSAFGEDLVLIAVIGYVYWCYDKELGRRIALPILLSNCWNPMIKNVFLRRRPYFESDKIELLRKIDKTADAYDIKAQGYSFPSGHSTNGVVVYGSLAHELKSKKLTILTIVAALVIGFSRMCVGAHYPTDVLCGWTMGLVAIFLVPYVQRKIKNKTVFTVLVLLSVLPGVFYCQTDDYFSTLGLVFGFLLSEPFEKKFTNFKNTRNILESVVRIAGGAGIYVALNFLLKLPFSEEFLTNGSLVSHLVRTGRYTVILFIVLAVYPMVFRYIRFSKDK